MDTTDLTWAEQACSNSGTIVALLLQLGFAAAIVLIWALCIGIL